MVNPLVHIPLPHWLLLGPLAIATYTDLRYGMIYNHLTLPTAALGLVVNGVVGGWAGLIGAGAGLGAGFLIFYFLYVVGRGQAMAAGDVKLMAAIGAWLGWPLILQATFYGILAGGVLALIHVAYHGKLGASLRRLWRILVSLVMPGLKVDLDFTRSEAPPFVYGPALALGTIACIINQSLTKIS